MELGQVENWDVAKYCDIIEMFITGDEIERALWLLDNPPAFYRDHYPLELSKLKSDLLSKIYTSNQYVLNHQDMGISDARAIEFMKLLRAQLVLKEVKALNEKGLKPFICEVGPGEYFLPAGLLYHGCEFSYRGIGVNVHAMNARNEFLSKLSRERKEGAPTLFVAYEILEHLWNPLELPSEMYRHCGDSADKVFLSTPTYTYDGRVQDWRSSEGLGHIRAYTPRETAEFARKTFPGYEWGISVTELTIMIGSKTPRL